MNEEFDVLSQFRVFTPDPPMPRDRTIIEVIKYYLTLPVSVLATVAIWALIARISSAVYLPIDFELGILLTLSGSLATCLIVFIGLSKGINYIERHLSSLPAARPSK